MTTTYDYQITRAHVKNLEGFPKAIQALEVEVTGTKEGISFSLPVRVELPEPSEGFVPFENLTPEIVKPWVAQKVALMYNILDHIELVLNRKIAEAGAKEEVLPWIVPPPVPEPLRNAE